MYAVSHLNGDHSDEVKVQDKDDVLHDIEGQYCVDSRLQNLLKLKRKILETKY